MLGRRTGRLPGAAETAGDAGPSHHPAGAFMTGREYIEAIADVDPAAEGLVLSPADTSLALAWHASGVPLADILPVVRGGVRLLDRRMRQEPRGPRTASHAANLRSAIAFGYLSRMVPAWKPEEGGNHG